MNNHSVFRTGSKKDGFKARKEGFSKSPLVHHLTEEELCKLKALLLEGFRDFDAIAQKHHIFYTASGGTVLGSIRHKGFIPWDDDIDLMMPRNDFELLKKVFDQELGDRYSLCSPEIGQNHGMSICQIKRKGTILRSYNEISKEDSGIPIDIFILENTFDSPLSRWLHGIACLAVGFLLSARKTYHDFPFLEPYFSGNAAFRASFRNKYLVGKLISFISVDQLSYITYRVYSLCHNDNSHYVSIPSGRNHYFGEMYSREDMCQARESDFEGIKIPIPAGYSRYLKALYGEDYMQLPPEKDRERHPIMELSFGEV